MEPILDPQERETRQRQDANWNKLPVILGLVFLFAIAFVLLSDSTNPRTRIGSDQGIDVPKTTQ